MKLILYLSNGLEYETPNLTQEQCDKIVDQITSKEQIWMGLADDASREGDGIYFVNNRQISMFKQLP
ncbi:hypothetical protein [Deinococcus actinosclerus]|uniref:hypothetical protein n=1 Tax=Deinococcus actinosclerus TaxID=1768108 RepID=UPI0012FA2A8B|nr:hypothetical protein [Deinococcus actinosclerus]